MARPTLSRASGVLIALGFGLVGACYNSLASVGSFPCATDGTCPPNFECHAVTMLCGPPLVCGEVDGSTAEQTDCSGLCVTTSSDPSNCGYCGNTCAVTDACCNGSCIDVTTDTSSCGMCGIVCPNGQMCVGGKCGCSAGQTYCTDSSTCVDESSDSNNCGSCGNVCNSSETCTGGKCACTAGETFCSGSSTCTDVETDSSNCGLCGHACVGAQSCSEGSCACVLPSMVCSGVCANLESDPNNCGACGMVCATGDICSGGTCCAVPATQPDSVPSACGPSPLCGCATGQNCDWVSLDNAWECETAGNVGAFQTCTSGEFAGSDCVPGYVCATWNGSTTTTCLPYCTCPSGETSCVDESVCGSALCSQLTLDEGTTASGVPGEFACDPDEGGGG